MIGQFKYVKKFEKEEEPSTNTTDCERKNEKKTREEKTSRKNT